MRLGDITNFSNEASLLNYCAANPDLEAGYSPGNASAMPQQLPCTEWPDVMGVAIAVPSTLSSVSTVSASWFTESTIDPSGTFPNWAVALGLGAALFFFLKKRR